MTVSIEYLSPAFHLTGDGVATSATLSLYDYPFVDFPKQRPTSVFVTSDGIGRISSASLDGSVVDLTFTSAFSGQSGPIALGFNFDLP